LWAQRACAVEMVMSCYLDIEARELWTSPLFG
jgi:hypothetical protein